MASSTEFAIPQVLLYYQFHVVRKLLVGYRAVLIVICKGYLALFSIIFLLLVYIFIIVILF